MRRLFTFGKRLLIVGLATLLISLPEIATDHPILFIAALLIDAFGIRLLWKSLQRDEAMKRPPITHQKYASRQLPDSKRAA